MRKTRFLFGLIFAVSVLQAAALNDPAPKFSLMDSHQQKRSLASYKGKVVFVNFWASWCAPCQLELPELDRLAAAYKGKRLQVVAINVDEKSADAKKLLRKLGLKDPAMQILWDPKSKAVSAYNVETMPSSFILDDRGKIRFIHSGFHAEDPALWRHEVDNLLG